MKLINSCLIAVLLCSSTTSGWAGFCDPLPEPVGETIAVSSEGQIRDLGYNAAPGTTLVIAPGIYDMNNYVHVVNTGVSLRGSTGDRGDVILDFGGMSSGYFGILVEADDVTIADLTIRNASEHGVAISGTDNPVLYNLHIIDINQQLVKVNPVGDGSENGLLACSLLEYTTSDPDGYTNGISAHNARSWTVRDNTWRRIRTYNNNPAPTILFWSGSRDTLVERNLLIDCFQGIAFGNASHGAGDHFGGIVRNNVIYNSLPHDVAVEMVHATDWLVAHNTVFLTNPTGGLTWGMEARYSDTYGVFYNNLTNMSLWKDRDGASGEAGSDNVTGAQAEWFVNPASTDFRLTSSAQSAIDHGIVIPGTPISDDFHGQSRDALPDVGADEWLPQLADLVATLQVVAGFASFSELVSDIDADARTGLAEAVFLLRHLAASP